MQLIIRDLIYRSPLKDNGTTTYRYVTDSKGYVVQIYSKWESAQGKTDAEEKLECEIIYE